MTSPKSSSVPPALAPDFQARALTIQERIDLHRKHPEAFGPDPERAGRVVQRWRSVLGRASDASIQDRLADFGIQESDLAMVVGTIGPEAFTDSPEPDWMEVCSEVAAWSGSFDADGLPEADFLDDGEGEESIPFKHALVPWVDIATRRILERCPAVSRVLSSDILKKQQLRLLENLAGFARFAFLDELEKRRLGMYSGNDFALGMLLGTPPRTAYIGTTRDLLGVGEAATGHWMDRYAALARLLGTRVVAWVRCLVEFLDRFEMDRDRIVTEFGTEIDPGPLTDLSFGSGDSHNGGRSVAICTFQSGLKIVYKPRNCGIDAAFSTLVGRFNEMLDTDLRLRVPRTLDRQRWGWAEFIGSAPCETIEDLRTYHRRLGSLLMVIHLLQGNDFHLENVKAFGADPIPIDLETVCVPVAGLRDPDAIVDAASEMIEHSVIRTLLLPSAMGMGGVTLQNLGAIRVEVADNQQRKGFKKLILVNTDFQRWIRSEAPDADQRPESEAWLESGEKITASEQLAETKAGFEAAYRTLLQRQRDLGGDASPIRVLGPTWVRVLNRATNVYMRLLMESCDVENVGDGVDRSLALERFGVGFAADMLEAHRPTTVELIRLESESLRDGDVAYFVARGSGTTYWTIEPETGEPVERPDTLLKTSALDAALDQVERMGESDLELQLSLQGDAYLSTVNSLRRMTHVGSSRSSVESEAGASVLQPEGSDRPLAECVNLGLDHIFRQAIESEDHLNWIDFNFDPHSEAIQPSTLDLSLYSGRGGISLLFERAYRLFGDRRWLECARKSIALEIKSLSARGNLELIRRWTPGGMTARAGLVSAAWAIGRHEGHGDHRSIAHELAIAVSDRTIQSDKGYDIIGGAAGYMLLLLRMHEEEPLEDIDPLLGRMADHLVAHASDMDGPGWRTFSEVPLCGFGHGRAGIALALLEAGRFLDRADLRKVALNAFEAEHRLRGETPARTWPDYRGVTLRTKDKAVFGASAWCAGSEGIALSRAAALQITDDRFLEDDLEFALETLPAPGPGRGHLCCGRAGRVLAHQTLRRLRSGVSLDEATLDRRIVSAMIESGLGPDGGGLMGVGLFQGLSGVLWTGMSLLEDDGSDLLLLRP